MFICNTWFISIAIIILITLFTIAACKIFQKSKPLINEECAANPNCYDDIKIVADMSRSGEIL